MSTLPPVNDILCGDALAVLKSLPSDYIQCVVTSPPYFRLRDYGVEGQIGLEETPQEYIAKLVEVFREVRRVLRHNGVCWINCGDTYATPLNTENKVFGNPEFNGKRPSRELTKTPKRTTPPGFKPKDLMMIPARLAIALQDDGWYLRSDCIWHKPTAMPESVTDRPTSAHEHVFLLAKSEQYYYDADAIREPLKAKTFTTFGTKHREQGNDALGMVKSDNWGRTVEERRPKLNTAGEIAGANKRNVWTVSSQPYADAHFATMPPKLVEPCILAGASPKACEHCLSPWTRMIERTPMIIRNGPKSGNYGSRTTDGLSGTMIAPSEARTVGWMPTCKCKNNTGSGKCVILDPFMGAGTVGLVALQHSRNYLGIELNPTYIDLAKKRIATVQPTLWSAIGENEVSA
jgi:site-specific DNA-methyltransferase (cytosine-N4-specific)